MGKKHLRLYQKVPPIPVDSQLCRSYNCYDWCCDIEYNSIECHPDVMGQLDHGLYGFFGWSNRTTRRIPVETKTLQKRREFSHINYDQKYRIGGYLSNRCPAVHYVQRKHDLRHSSHDGHSQHVKRRRLSSRTLETRNFVLQHLRVHAAVQRDQRQEDQLLGNQRVRTFLQ